MDRRSIFLHAGWLAGAVFVLAVMAVEYSARGSGASVHLLGPGMVRLAPWFDMVGFLLPGGLLLVFALGVRGRVLPAGRAAGVAASLFAIAALCFALIGLLPFDPDHAEGARSRLHSTAVVFGVLAMLAALPLAACASWRAPGGRGAALVLVTVAAVMAATMAAPLRPPVLAQRVLLGLFFAGPAWLALRALRRQPPL